MHGRSGSGGKTRQVPSSCRKNSISTTSEARDASTRTHRPRLAVAVLNAVTRLGIAPFGTSQLSTVARNDLAENSMMTSAQPH